MDYSLLLGVHVLDQSQREGGELGQAGGDGRRPVGQRVLYSTAMESIQGDGKAAESLTTDDTMGGIPAKTHKEEKLFIFLGIIDILQSYRFIKKLEHSWKALVYDGDSVSVHRPGFYASRFLKFMSTRVFRKTQPLRFSPSKRTRTSIPALKSSSQEILSLQADERKKEDRRDRLAGACSLASLDGRGVFGSYLRPDLVPANPSFYEGSSMGTISTSSIFVNVDHKTEEREDAASSSTFTLEDSAICLTSEQSTMDVDIDRDDGEKSSFTTFISSCQFKDNRHTPSDGQAGPRLHLQCCSIHVATCIANTWTSSDSLLVDGLKEDTDRVTVTDICRSHATS
ncbi:Phosphatidylinositol 4-phosphate 5-kinase type-1 beta [Liparis tanakae]|uniref:Phosphatidylinositol 4-phosphate 5-kinase type-1 beta n=1 Tax=Liparis tanakae TaxID=230148 RepID=A0A4Z2IAE8_9TELE|nr:Phosphatidylinositol 4-phosphate 5-kinase type-1 beta [Liparis tanakae]